MGETYSTVLRARVRVLYCTVKHRAKRAATAVSSIVSNNTITTHIPFHVIHYSTIPLDHLFDTIPTVALVRTELCTYSLWLLPSPERCSEHE